MFSRYLTAESDEPEAFDENVLREFLVAHGYEALVQEMEPPKRRAPRTRRVKEPEVEAKSDEQTVPEDECIPEIEFAVFELELEDEDKVTPSGFGGELDDVDILTLIHAMRLKAACGAEGASAALQKLYAILLG